MNTTAKFRLAAVLCALLVLLSVSIWVIGGLAGWVFALSVVVVAVLSYILASYSP